MTASTKAFFLYPPAPALGAGHINPPSGGLLPENSPAWLWGQGTPGAIAPFTTVNKGSIYSEVNATDDYGPGWMKTDEGGDAADWAKILVDQMTIAQTYVATELHAWELNYTATAASGANMVGLNIAVTTAGTAASWVSGLFIKISQGTTKNVNGYFSAAELELNCECETSSAMAVLVLNSNITAMGSDNQTSLIKIQDWGTEEMPYLLDFSQWDTGSNVKTQIFSSSSSEMVNDYAIRCVGPSQTAYWIGMSSAGPA